MENILWYGSVLDWHAMLSVLCVCRCVLVCHSPSHSLSQMNAAGLPSSSFNSHFPFHFGILIYFLARLPISVFLSQFIQFIMPVWRENRRDLTWKTTKSVCFYHYFSLFFFFYSQCKPSASNRRENVQQNNDAFLSIC